MRIVLSFEEVTSPGIDKFKQLYLQSNKLVIEFLNTTGVELKVISRVNHESIKLVMPENYSITDTINFIIKLSKEFPFLAYECFLFRRKLEVRAVLNNVLPKFSTLTDEDTIVIAKSSKLTKLYDLYEILDTSHILNQLELKNELKASFIFQKSITGKAFNKSLIFNSLAKTEVINNPAWIGCFDTAIKSFNIYVDSYSAKYPNHGNSLEIDYYHFLDEPFVKVISKVHGPERESVKVYELDLTITEFSYWLNGICCNLSSDLFCAGFMFFQLEKYLKGEG